MGNMMSKLIEWLGMAAVMFSVPAHDRNQLLYKIADAYPNVVYDGMDVGPVE